MPSYPTAAAAGSTVTLPTVIGTRWTQDTIRAGMVVAEHALDTVDVLASEGDGTIVESGKFASLAIASATLTAQTDLTPTSTWYSDDASYYWTTDPVSGARSFALHISCQDATVEQSIVECYGLRDGSTSNGWHWQVDNNGTSSVKFYTLASGSSTTKLTVGSVTDAKLEAGYWLRTTLYPSGEVRAEYVQGAIGSQPSATDWVFGWQGASQTVADDVLRFGFAFRYIGGGAAPLWDFGFLQISNSLDVTIS